MTTSNPSIQIDIFGLFVRCGEITEFHRRRPPITINFRLVATPTPGRFPGWACWLRWWMICLFLRLPESISIAGLSFTPQNKPCTRGIAIEIPILSRRSPPESMPILIRSLFIAPEHRLLLFALFILLWLCTQSPISVPRSPKAQSHGINSSLCGTQQQSNVVTNIIKS